MGMARVLCTIFSRQTNKTASAKTGRGPCPTTNTIIQIDQNLLETELDRLVTEKITRILNAILDAEADEITGAARYERTNDRKAFRAGHYDRRLTAKAGQLELKIPKLKSAVFESAVIERYRRREQSVEESPIDMYRLARAPGSGTQAIDNGHSGLIQFPKSTMVPG